MSAQVFSIRVEGDEAGDETRSLVRWLREDPQPGLGRVTMVDAPVEQGRMGALTDIIEVVMQPDGVATALVTAISTWLATRRNRSRIVMTRAGRRVEFDVPPDADVDTLVRRVVDELDAE